MLKRIIPETNLNTINNSKIHHSCSIKVFIQQSVGLQICHKTHAYPITVTRGETLSFRVWHEASAELDFNCLLYCTEDGDLPSIHEGTKISQEALDKLVKEMVEK